MLTRSRPGRWLVKASALVLLMLGFSHAVYGEYGDVVINNFADKAGMNQLAVPAELSVIRVMCSGRVEPTLILEAFQKGADGVMVLACHPGDCHYKEGNLRAFCRAELLERLIPQLGIDPARFLFDYVSAAEAEKFARITTDFVAGLRALEAPPELEDAANGH